MERYVNACWVMGQLVASIVLRSMLSLDSQWAYRIPFGLQWAFPIPVFVVVALAPERYDSPIGANRIVS